VQLLAFTSRWVLMFLHRLTAVNEIERAASPSRCKLE
jgi:hypothetical protein